MKTLVKNVKRFGIALAALMLLVSISGFASTASAQTSTETDFMNILNGQRISLGKNPLAINSSLSTAAYLHSKDMAEKGYFSHTSLDGRTFVQRVVAAGYTSWTALAENIAYYYGSADATTIYNMWKDSPGHYANMIGDFTDAGLGVYTLNNYTYCTLDFGKTSSPIPPPAPNFSLSASPSALNIAAGNSTSSTIAVTSVGSFNGTVGLTIAPVPAGWMVTLAPTSLAIVSGGSRSSLLSITVPSSAQTGTYTFTVSGTSGSISHSATVIVNTQGIRTTPSAPQNLKATAGNVQVALTWSAPSLDGATAPSNYRVYRRTASTSPTLLATLGKVFSYNDSAVTNGQTYYYTVTAVNSAGESPKSNEVYATPATPAAKVLNVAVSTNSPVYARGSYGSLAVTVTDGSPGNRVTGAAVTIKIYCPSGAVAGTVYRTTDANGNAKIYFSFGSYAQLGTYRITATVSQTGYEIGIGQATFTVR
ncbi:MAG: CAP domain-containing protein [Dehalococcoidia bacterium]|nr:CAP domain-containing protein [Dehalococcoidia bacterium]